MLRIRNSLKDNVFISEPGIILLLVEFCDKFKYERELPFLLQLHDDGFDAYLNVGTIENKFSFDALG